MHLIPSAKLSTPLALSIIILLTMLPSYYFQQFQTIQPIAISSKQLQKPTLIQSNHYFSTKQHSVNYNIVKVKDSTLPLLIIPKQSKSSSSSISLPSNLTLTLNDNHNNYISCQFSSIYDICVLDKFDPQLQQISMLIQCISLPCEFSWQVIQAPVQIISQQLSILPKTSTKQLYSFQTSKNNKHYTIKLTCDNPQLINQFKQQIKFYSNQKNLYNIKTDSINYYLINNPPLKFKEYFYMKIQQKYRKCAEIQIYTEDDQIEAKNNYQVKDFILKNKQTVYNIKRNQQNNYRIDVNMHFFQDNNNSNNKQNNNNNNNNNINGNVNIKLTAHNNNNNGARQTIKKMNLIVKTRKQVQFSFTMNQIPPQYSTLQLHFQSPSHSIIMSFILISQPTQSIQKGQFSFYSLSQGQSITYQLIPTPKSSSLQKIHIFSSQPNKTNLTLSQCLQSSGCQFKIIAKQNIDGSIYIGQSSNENTEEIIKYQIINNSFSKKVKQDTIIYIKKHIQQNKNYKILVNTHNVILYASLQQKCQFPSLTCHSHIGNSHRPIIFSSLSSSSTLIISLHSLDQSQPTITIIQQNNKYSQLKNGIPLTYLMDKSEEEVVFKFNLDQKQDVTFSVISPLNQIEMYVFNIDKKNKNKNDNEKLLKNYKQKYIRQHQQHQQYQYYTIDGYIKIQSKKQKSPQFLIVISKLDPSITETIHFTIIASTKNTNIKLQNGVTHYQKLTEKQHQEFVIEFDPQKKYVISFYLNNFDNNYNDNNINNNNINLELILSKDDNYQDGKSISNKIFTIDKIIDEINISQQGKKICSQKGTQSCQLFMRITNKMPTSISLQLTLLNINAIIQLYDGIWQYFPQQLLSSSASFYFFPKHLNNPINIIFKSNNPDLRLIYTMIKMDEKQVNPEEWPFPKINKNDKQTDNLKVKQVKSFNLDVKSLKQCTPNCLVLISLVKVEQAKGGSVNNNQLIRDQQFGLLVSNNIIQIPQKLKIQLTIQKDQQKHLKMNLNSAIQHSTLTTFIYTSLGSISLYANTCSQKSFRIPTPQQFDFSFGYLQTQLKMSTLIKKYQQNQINLQKQTPLLCILVKGQQNSKFSIEYTSDEEIVSLIGLDDERIVQIDGKQDEKYIQIDGTIDGEIKIVRNKGFPVVQMKICTGKKQKYDQCLHQLKQKPITQSYQILQKVKKLTYSPCTKCIVYLKISSQQPSSISLHLQSKYSQISLSQNKITTDYLQKNIDQSNPLLNDENKYQITTLTNEVTYININVLDGNVKCIVSDFQNINLEKSTNDKVKTLQFVIRPQHYKNLLNTKNTKNNQLQFFSFLLSSFGLQSTFTTLHLTLISLDPSKSASYTIQYSSGQRESYLQDGLVYKYNLQGNNPKSIVKFYYQNINSDANSNSNNDENSNVYLFLGTKKSNQLTKLYISIYSMQSLQQNQQKVQISSKIPQLRKKSSKPTILFPLPSARFYSIQAINPTGQQIQLSLGINHQQLILLPYNIEYPFILSTNSIINMIINTQSKGYLTLILKKCDQSVVELSYTTEYQMFKQGEFDQMQIIKQNDVKFQQIIKIKSKSTVYLQVKKMPNIINTEIDVTNSVFAIEVRYSQIKGKSISDYVKAGEKGLINYQFENNNKIKIQFAEVQCGQNSKCPGKFEYFLLSSQNRVQVYSQTVCSSTYFADTSLSSTSSPASLHHTLLPLHKITSQSSPSHKISYIYQPPTFTHITYLSIKAIYTNKQNQQIQVYYQPVQILTLLGQVQKISSKNSSKLKYVAIGIIIFILLICIRRQKRKDYQVLQQNQ